MNQSVKEAGYEERMRQVDAGMYRKGFQTVPPCVQRVQIHLKREHMTTFHVEDAENYFPWRRPL